MPDSPKAKSARASVPRPRHDAFDGDRRRKFLAALAKTGCIRDAARTVGVSHQTVYDHQARDKAFAHHCDLALGMAATSLELHAWERGVVGIEEAVIYHGEVVGTRVRRSDAILKLLLQGAHPRKYGPNPGFGRRRLHRLERQRIEREVRDEARERERAKAGRDRDEEVTQTLLKQFAVLDRRADAERVAKGYIKVGKDWIPPGWVRADGGGREPDDAIDTPDGAEEIPDSV